MPARLRGLTVARVLARPAGVFGNGVLAVPPSTSVADSMRAMAKAATGTLLVADGGHVRGIVSEKDYLTKLVHGSWPPADVKVSEIMHPVVEPVTGDAMLPAVVASLLAQGRRHAPVLSDGAAAAYGRLAPAALPAAFPLSAFTSVVSLRDLVTAAAATVFDAERAAGLSDEQLRVGGGGGGHTDLTWASSVEQLLAALKAEGRQALQNTRVSDNLTVSDAVNRLAESGHSCLLVTDTSGTGLAGVFTARDFLNRVVVPGLNAATTRVKDVMTQRPVAVAPDRSLLKAARMMVKGRFRHLPVVLPGGGDAPQPLCVGIISLADVARGFVTPADRADAAAAEAAAIAERKAAGIVDAAAPVRRVIGAQLLR
jgi:CBS domain-containing protein